MTSYKVSSENRALLRWSLWEAQKKRCYICLNPFEFRRIELDHVIPKATPVKKFNELWAKFGHGMTNDGIHAITNLRACCEACNSSSGKGSIHFSDSTLDLHLAKSAEISSAALDVQRRILQSGDFGKSAIVLASARTDTQYEFLWDPDVNQALMAVLHRASQVLENGRTHRVPTITSPYWIELETDGKSARLLAAMQLASGLSPADLAESVVDSAVENLDEQIARTAVANRNLFSGAAAGTTDWARALFKVSIESVAIEDDVVTYSCRIELDENVAVTVAAQSSDGSSLEDSQADLSVEGSLIFTATTELGDRVRSSPRVDEAQLVSDDVYIEA